MRRLIVLIVLAASLAVPASAQANAATLSVPLHDQITACNNDTIQLDGQLLLVGIVNATPSGGFMFSVHTQPQGVSGVDLQTGTKFLGTGVTRDILILSPGGVITETLVDEFRIQATAGAESFVVRVLLHATVSPNGDLVSVVDQVSTTC